ncbi:MAG: glycosyltransferase [Victivallaceae bacterium]|nr:glycosyltransferase [Victivallaceae bacterium]
MSGHSDEKDPPFFSVVIPACGVGKYIAATVESVKKQSPVSFETLIVCEESADGTLENAVAATCNDQRFQIVSLPRSGSASVSRNYGMEHARGKYLVFLDGDDLLEPGALMELARLAEANAYPDVIACEYVNWGERPGAPSVRYGGERPLRHVGRTLSGVEALTEALEDGTYRSATWRNIYRTEFLRGDSNLRQIPGRRHQDDEWTPRVFYAAKRVFISGVVLYHYLKRAGSVTTIVSTSSMRDVSANIDSALKFYKASDFPPRLKRAFAHWQLYAVSKFFSPAWKQLYPLAERRKEFRKLMLAHGNLLGYLSLIVHGRARDIVFSGAVLFALVVPCFPLMEKVHVLIYGGGRMTL